MRVARRVARSLEALQMNKMLSTKVATVSINRPIKEALK